MVNLEYTISDKQAHGLSDEYMIKMIETMWKDNNTVSRSIFRLTCRLITLNKELVKKVAIAEDTLLFNTEENIMAAISKIPIPLTDKEEFYWEKNEDEFILGIRVHSEQYYCTSKWN